MLNPKKRDFPGCTGAHQHCQLSCLRKRKVVGHHEFLDQLPLDLGNDVLDSFLLEQTGLHLPPHEAGEGRRVGSLPDLSTCDCWTRQLCMSCQGSLGGSLVGHREADVQEWGLLEK